MKEEDIIKYLFHLLSIYIKTVAKVFIYSNMKSRYSLSIVQK